ncbi:uncharacterized protein BDV17DRAFT_127814 [Aspergillus undulatus]|uniref:uncharacterized protein n=1 Tax=Aspergillus undulatus TaxID=1810928 RepID=UPI003CCD371F
MLTGRYSRKGMTSELRASVTEYNEENHNFSLQRHQKPRILQDPACRVRERFAGPALYLKWLIAHSTGSCNRNTLINTPSRPIVLGTMTPVATRHRQDLLYKVPESPSCSVSIHVCIYLSRVKTVVVATSSQTSNWVCHIRSPSPISSPTSLSSYQ